jgi:hypothetical protein
MCGSLLFSFWKNLARVLSFLTYLYSHKNCLNVIVNCPIKLREYWHSRDYIFLIAFHTSTVQNPAVSFSVTLKSVYVKNRWSHEIKVQKRPVLFLSPILSDLAAHLETVEKVVSNDDNSVAAWISYNTQLICTQLINSSVRSWLTHLHGSGQLINTALVNSSVWRRKTHLYGSGQLICTELINSSAHSWSTHLHIADQPICTVLIKPSLQSWPTHLHAADQLILPQYLMKSVFNSNHWIFNPCSVFITVHAFGQSQYQLFSVAININPFHAQPPVHLVLIVVCSLL